MIRPIFCAICMFGAFHQSAIGGPICDNANARIEPHIEKAMRKAANTTGLNRSACITLEIGIMVEWAVNQCATDTTLGASDHASLNASAKEYRKNNIQLHEVARDIADNRAFCPLDDVQWTGYIFRYR